jgi:hypothetical protein
VPDLVRAICRSATLLAARGVAVLNAVRGARALVALDGTELGPQGPALAERLAAVFFDE